MSFTHGLNEFFSIIVPPLFPFLVPDLGITYTQASLLVVVFYTVYSIVQLGVGRLVDIYSAQKLLGFGIVLMASGIGLVALAPTFPLMLGGMVVAGIGGSTYHPTGMSVISDVESESTHGRSMGIHGAIGILGPVIAPLVMAAVAAALSWRTALLVGSALGILAGLLVYGLYPVVEPDEASLERTPSLRQSIQTAITDQSIGRSLRNAIAFVRAPTMLSLILLFAIVGAEVRSVQAFTPVVASALVGTDPAFGNLMLAVTMVAAGVASTIAGYFTDRFDRRYFVGGCFLLTAVTITGLVLFPLGRIVLPAGFILLGIVLYSVYPAINAIAAGAATPQISGSVFAVSQTAAALGAAAGPFLVGVVADATSLRCGFLAISGIAVLGILLVVVTSDLFL